MTTTNHISERVALIKIRMPTMVWDVRDEREGEAMAAGGGAQKSAVKIYKRMIPDAFRRMMNEANHDLDVAWKGSRVAPVSLPYEDGGWRACRASSLPDIRDAVERAIAKRREVIEYGRVNWESFRAMARAQLGSLFREELFPRKSELDRIEEPKFQARPVPSVDFRWEGLSDAEMESAKAALLHDRDAALGKATAEIGEVLRDMLTQMSTALGEADQKGTQYGKMAATAKRAAEALRKLNLSGSPEIDSTIDGVERVLAEGSPETLRESRIARGTKRAAVNAELSKLGALFGFASPAAEPAKEEQA
jgi:hypothetical protein